jgi:hypothetical protein
MILLYILLIAQRLTWFDLAVGLFELAGFFGSASIIGYFTIHELTEKEVKKIKNRRLRTVRTHLSELAKKCVESKEITEDIENQFQKLFDDEYTQAYEPTGLLKAIDRLFLFSGIFFFATALLDWANSNSSVFSVKSLGFYPLEGELFAIGILLLGIGLLDLERLRRMTIEEVDLDPAPLDVVFMLGLVFACDIYILWLTGTVYSDLTHFGRWLFFSSLLTIPAIILALSTWEKQDWKRILGVILLFAPFLVVLFALILSTVHIPFP